MCSGDNLSASSVFPGGVVVKGVHLYPVVSDTGFVDTHITVGNGFIWK
jgi:hypothetical protein